MLKVVRVDKFMENRPSRGVLGPSKSSNCKSLVAGVQ